MDWQARDFRAALGSLGAHLKKPAWMTSATRAGNAHLPRAAGAEGRKLRLERPELCLKGRGQQRQPLGHPEGGTMGDEMDAMIPEREMKVRAWLGPPCLRSPGVALEPRLCRLLLQFAGSRSLALQSVRSSACRGQEFPASAGTCPCVGLATPSELPWVL